MLQSRRAARVTVVVATAFLSAPLGARAQTALAKANSDSGPDVRLELTELKRTSGDTVTLKGVIINDSGRTFNPAPTHQIYLLDTKSKMKHVAARDSSGKWIGSPARGVKANARWEFWAKFGAPAESVQKLTVVIPKFPPLEDVPLSR